MAGRYVPPPPFPSSLPPHLRDVPDPSDMEVIMGSLPQSDITYERQRDDETDLDTDQDTDSDTEEYERVSEENVPYERPGTKSEVKNAYGVQDRKTKKIKWENEPPVVLAQEQAARQNAEEIRSGYAIVHRKVLDADEEWTTHSIQIINNKLKAFLNKVMDYPAMPKASKSTMLLHPPFKPLFEASERFISEIKEEEDDEVRIQAELLYDLLSETWKPFHEDLQESKLSGRVAPKSIWTLFPPRTHVVFRLQGQLCVGELRFTTFTPRNPRSKAPPAMLLNIQVLNWNGMYCGWQTEAVQISQDAFEDTIKIHELPVYPLSFHNDPDGLKEMLIERGRKFESLRGCHFKSYNAFGLGNKVEQRIVVDAYAYWQFSGRNSVSMYPLNHLHLPQPSNNKLTAELQREPVEDEGIEEIFANKGPIPRNQPHGHPQKPVPSRPIARKKPLLQLGGERRQNIEPLTDEQCLCAVPYVYGFDLQKKAWRLFNIINIGEISWNVDAYSQLVLSQDQKRLILAFSKSKQGQDLEFDDFISGKGKGMIMLLCGSPGVGKTLTAESVAEELKVPLYRLGAGDLGIEANGLEEQLERALEICTLWKAVLLIDEADVFMETRNMDSLARNELVSVFLRLVEYYRGIMFLTTNRVFALDPAFESRIDLIVPFQDLDSSARLEIWWNFILKLSPEAHEIGESELNEVATWKLNGREIKNLIKTGLVLGKSEGKLLTMEQLRAVWSIRQQAAVAIAQAGK